MLSTRIISTQMISIEIKKSILCLISLLISFTAHFGFAADIPNQSKIWKDSRFNLPRKSGVVLFKLKKNKQLADLQLSFINSLDENIDFSGSKLVSTLSPHNSLYEFSFSTLQSTFDSNAHLEEAYANKLLSTGLVEFAEPDYIYTPDMVANDSDFSNQWYLQKISAPAAWDVTTGSNKVQVLICDTGIMSSHPDLKENILNQGHNFADDSDNTEPSGNPHGTLVAGLIGAKGNNGIGIAGLNWNVQIIPGKISNDVKGAAQASTMVKCIQWAIDHHIRVVNLSYSGTGSEAVLDASKALFENNGMLIYTIGNSGEEVMRPPNPYGLTVGSTDDYDFRTPWSNTGDALDIVAPGLSILSTDANGDYKRVQGTSYSAPLVAGAVALLMSLDPELPIKDIRQIILDSAQDIGIHGKDKAFGYGRLDVNKAVQLYKKHSAGN